MTLKTKANLVISVLIVALALPAVALADLRIAIDDGTSDRELFVYLNELKHSDDFAVLRRAPYGEEIRTTYTETAGSDLCVAADYRLQKSVAITSPFGFEMNRGVTIISDDVIDAKTQDDIRNLLAEAGHADAVVFMDASGFDSRPIDGTKGDAHGQTPLSHETATSN